VQKRGANIEQVGPVDAFVFLDSRSTGNKDAELTMLDSRAGRLARDSGWTQVIGVKAMIGHEDDGSLVAGEPENGAEHHVVVAVSPFEAIVENPEIPVIDVVLLGRAIPHEGVAKVVDSIVVNSHEIPRLFLDECGSSGVNGCAIGNNLQQHLHPGVFLRLIEICPLHAVEARKKWA
jgi:hypothetical protein